MTVAFLESILVWAIPVLLAVILHEVAHGVVAYALGDPTAKEAGRLTLNPLPHIDPMGTVVLPLFLLAVSSPFLFGYARPVPVNFARLGHPRRDMVLVAAAGPLTNLLLAAAFALLLRVLVEPGLALAQQGFWAQVALRGVLMNVVLAVFNMLPVPPLDGGRVLTGLLPPPLARAYAQVERFGMVIVILLLVSNVAGTVMHPISRAILRWLLG